MKISIRRTRGAQFEGLSESGQKALLDGPPNAGGQGEGVRPMELVLMGMAGCSALDVLHILGQQHQPIEDLEVHVEAQRADAIPAVLTQIDLHYVASGAIDLHKLERAVKLSLEKYCSVSRMLESTAKISHRITLREPTT
ncbi:MAG: OsmC family protein [Deltaproteobacteria bacterium]|nr:OsmC family protein [Deltaproteobacteria bacterium]